MTMTTSRRSSRSGANGSGMPAMSDPMVISTRAGNHGLDRPRQVEARNQLELRDGRDEIALVQAARLVVDEDDAAADHDHHEDRHHDRSRAADTGCTARTGRSRPRPASAGSTRRAANGRAPPALPMTLPIDAGQRGRDEVVAVVLDQRDAGRLAGQHAARVVGRNRQHAVQPAVAQVLQRRAFVGIQHRVEGAGRRRPPPAPARECARPARRGRGRRRRPAGA